MAKVLLKKSSVPSNAPGTGDLDYGELAINYADGRLYYKNSSNVIKNFVDSDTMISEIEARVAGITDVVQDTTPQLGGNLDLNSYSINGTGGINITGNIALSGTVDGRDVAADGTKLDGIEANAKDDQTITSGKGLNGGGTGDLTLNIDSAELYAQFNHDDFNDYVADEHIAHSGVTITAGAGLTGGGTIAASRSFAVGAGVGIKVSADAVSIDSAEIVNYQIPIHNLFSAAGDLSYSNGEFSFSETYSSASELLTAIKTVDGASSGLDADLLDGQHGSYYRIDVYDASGTLLN